MSSTDATNQARRAADRKEFRDGTHRALAPRETLARLTPFLTRIGITRVASVTGLDRIGVAVVVVTRPLSRSLSVTQGKGLSLEAAKVSGIMEAIEHHHAEAIELPLRLATEAALPGRVIATATMQTQRPEYARDVSSLWLLGRTLLDGANVWVPYDAVHLDLRVPPPTGGPWFAVSSNGLASGNSVEEATAHGLFEVVERHLTALFYALDAERQDELRVDLSSVVAPRAAELIERILSAGVQPTLWDISGELGVPCFFCELLDQADDTFRGIPRARGVGCHTDREIALVRAVTEAAQSRLTLVSGARDDIADVEPGARRAAIEAAHAEQRARGARPASRDYRSAPSHDFECFSDEVAWLARRAADAGLGEAVVVDLSKAGFPVAVVRVVLPGALGGHSVRTPAAERK